MLNEGEKTVFKWLTEHSFNNQLSLHTKEVERSVIESGKYCLSTSRYLRSLRLQGYIEYPDPRANEHIYKITILSDIEGHPIHPAKESEYIEQGRLFL